MAETYTLDAQSRTVTGKKVHQLRVQGLVPAVIYGARIEPIHLQIPYRPLELALMEAGGTRLINVNVGGSDQLVITREVQRDVLRGTIMHVDFLAVDATTRLRTEVPIHLVGVSPAIETRIGILLNGAATVTLEALPTDLVDAIDVDISGLKEVGDTIHVSDLKLNPNVIVLNDPDELVVRINALREIVEEEPTEAVEAEITPSEPELVQRRRPEDEAEEE